MAAHLFIVFSLLNVAFARNHGALSSEEIHWKSKFPNTPMPEALKNLLPPPPSGKSKELEGVNAPINPFIIYENRDKAKKSKGVNAPINPFIIYEKQSKGNKNSLGRKHGNASMNETIYFFQEDLRPGKMVKLPLVVKPRDFTTFLPQQVAQSIPFSSDNFPEILKHFSFGSDSTEADAMKQTIKGCERRAMRGEQMFCATSFDSFVDLSVSKLGKNIQLLASELGKETSNPMFTIGRGIQNMGEEELVCHKMMYPYAVFLCHSIEGTVVYKVTLVGTDRMKANAVAICHKDTSAWSPDHPAFFILNVKPGTIPICHFVVRDTLVWVRK
ncbi:BURP domain protein RD22-like [Hibiscus syriacus]|uniref:BURP domain protein RD22-like n=1 Tax=Hibiscus syriacus TaxID=106335 RepID=UPI0019220BD7|nr:BURP domain protein RD22-like [Hibiscus syriacus]